MLPKAVQAAADKAQAIQDAMSGKTETPAPEVIATVVAAPVEVVAQAAPPPIPVDQWEHKYRVLANKYSAEVPRLAQEIRELKDKAREMSDKQALAPAAVAPSDMTPSDVVEKYGDDFAAAVGALATRISDAQGSKLREEFAPKMDAVTSQVNVNARQEFMRRLSDAIPDWQIIDQDAAFTAFLDEYDAMTGRPRRDFFTEADRNNDWSRVISFFSTYREKSSGQKQTQQETAKNAVEYSLSPASNRTSEAPVGKRIWAPADIRKFYDDARRGLIAGAEYDRIESDIFAARDEGRLLTA